MSRISEREPLINRSDAITDAEAAASAFQSGAFDPNASAFAPAASMVQPAEGVLVTEQPMRKDLFLVLGGVWTGTFLAAFDSTVVSVALATIGSEFNSSSVITWIGLSFLLSQTAFQPLYGRLSDIFGRKPAILFASVVFAIGTLGCGLSNTFPQLVAARAVAGIGGGGLTTMSSIVTSDLVPLRKRGTYQGLGNVVYALGASIGAPLGGYLTQTIGWRMAFLIQLPLCLIHFIICLWKVNIPSGPGSPMEKIKRIDVLGAITMVSSVCLFLIGVSLGGNQYPWSHPIIWGCIVAAVIDFTIFVLVEKYVAKEPIMPLRVLFNRTPFCVSFTNWFISMAQFGIIFSFPLYLAVVWGNTNAQSGLHLIPNAVFASTASLLCGIYMARTGVYRTLLISLGVLVFAGPLWMATYNRSHTTAFELWVAIIPHGLAYGGILTITLVALISAVDPVDMAAATGVSYLFRATGSVLGISVTTAILQNMLQSRLPRYITGKHAHKIIERIRADVGYISELPADLQAGAILAYEQSFRVVFICITVFAFLGFLAVLGVRQHELPGRLDRKK